MSFTWDLPPVPSLSLVPQQGGGTGGDRIAGDLALVWSAALGDADLSLVLELASGAPVDLATDRGLVTAALISLFTDRRAEDDDVPPSGDARDRRGCWMDQFAIVEGDLLGSRLWLLARSKRSNETVARAKEYALEALAWMAEDRVVASIDVAVETSATAPALFSQLGMPTTALLIGVALQRPGKDPVSFRFAHTWDHLEAA